MGQKILREKGCSSVEGCSALRMDVELGAKLVHTFVEMLQGVEVDAERGAAKVGRKTLVRFIKSSLLLLSSDRWMERYVRQWAGMALFVSDFKKLLRAHVFPVSAIVSSSRCGEVVPSLDVFDEILGLIAMCPLAEINLQPTLSPEISRTDVSATGGAISIATEFGSSTLGVASQQDTADVCCVCDSSFTRRGGIYPCSRQCGAAACSPQCLFSHAEGRCSRDELDSPSFGERFAEWRFPLTHAVAMAAMAGVAIQPFVGPNVETYSWDFYTEQGRRKLEQMECDQSLAAVHWSPGVKTFVSVQGSKELRSKSKPWGNTNLTTNENVWVRKDNAMAKRGLQGLKDGLQTRRIVSLCHPYDSFLWETSEMKALLANRQLKLAVYSLCCHGGASQQWECLVTNDLPLRSFPLSGLPWSRVDPTQ